MCLGRQLVNLGFGYTEKNWDYESKFVKLTEKKIIKKFTSVIVKIIICEIQLTLIVLISINHLEKMQLSANNYYIKWFIEHLIITDIFNFFNKKTLW